jgi:protein-disulfide isomerase
MNFEREPIAMKLRVLSTLVVIAVVLSFFQDVNCQSVDSKRNDAVVAVINGKQSITLREVDEAGGAQLQALLEKVYSLRKKALDDLITRTLLEDEARTRRLTIESLKQELLPNTAKISPNQVDQFYAEHRDSFGTLGEEEAKQRIRMDMETRERLDSFKKAIQELKAKAQIATFLALPPAPVVSVDSKGPSKGSADGVVTIIEFSDFQCPYCKRVITTLEQVLQAYQGKIRLVFKHAPLPGHPEAYKAAQASVCAAEQDRFWEYHDRLFNSSDFSAKTLKRIADELNLNRNRFEACFDSESSRAVVARDLQEAKKIGVQGTPTFVINGRLYRGALSFEAFKTAIDQELGSKEKGQTAPVVLR